MPRGSPGPRGRCTVAPAPAVRPGPAGRVDQRPAAAGQPQVLAGRLRAMRRGGRSAAFSHRDRNVSQTRAAAGPRSRAGCGRSGWGTGPALRRTRSARRRGGTPPASGGWSPGTPRTSRAGTRFCSGGTTTSRVAGREARITPGGERVRAERPDRQPRDAAGELGGAEHDAHGVVRSQRGDVPGELGEVADPVDDRLVRGRLGEGRAGLRRGRSASASSSAWLAAPAERTLTPPMLTVTGSSPVVGAQSPSPTQLDSKPPGNRIRRAGRVRRRKEEAEVPPG